MIHLIIQKIKKLLNSPGFVAGVLIVSLIGLGAQILLPSSVSSDALNSRIEHDIRVDLDALTPALNTFQAEEAKHGLNIASPEEIDTRRSEILLNLSSGNLKSARSKLNTLKRDLDGWRTTQNAIIASASAPSGNVITAPILIYHDTPGNFEAQLQELKRKNYTTITLDELVAGFANPAALPAKPVVITFDDGFANQMRAYELLKKYQMKATFYIVTGGERSGWCLGINRHNELKCGDSYLNWDQLKELDTSGLITIGNHTVDHSNLAKLSASDQQFEIKQAKDELEARLGHPIRHFAYPYGSFTGTTISLVRAAGFVTAVSTLPGANHSRLTQYTLHRERDVFKLP